MLRPRSVVIVGASDRSRWSQAAFDNLAGNGFAGDIHLVNRRGGTVHGRTALASCAALPPGVDMGIVLVPAEAAAAAVRDLAAAGVGTVAILTSGFAETGPAGAALQQDLAETARRAGVRLLGPNTLGFLNFADNTRVWTTPVPVPVRTDGVAIISQSGATAFFLTGLAVRMGVGLSHVVSTGNEADLDCASFVEELAGSEAVRAIALFIETVRSPDRFRRAVDRARAAGKPVVVLKVGRSETSARSALAHTGALVGDDRVFEGVCRQHGLIRVHAIEDLLATADLCARAGRLRPGGLGVVSNSGGICEIASDAADARGIALPPFTPAGTAALREALPAFATPHNPLDVTGGVTPEQCGAIAATMAAEPDLAALLCPWYDVPTEPAEVNDRLLAIYRHMAGALRAGPIPGFFVSYTAAAMNAHSHDIVAETGLPYLACGLDRALTAMAGLMWWSRLGPAAATPQPPPVWPGARPHDERTALEHLARHGVPIVPAGLATSADEAVRLAAEATRDSGGAVALKIASPEIGHKSDIGGVALNLLGAEAVREAYGRIMAAARRHAPAATLDGVLVSPMRPRGIELFVGVTRDPQWGPVLAVGLGGVWVEVLQDVALRLLPATPAEIRTALTELRGAAMLAGSRGLPPADLDAVAAAVARIGDAALALGPTLAALDVNPLWVHGPDVEALDALCVWAEPALDH
ncbi:MAG: acetate--CoA ligase family protein [Janthinobacterium lividum]